MMRTLRIMVLVGLVVKAILLGTIAFAERPSTRAEPPSPSATAAQEAKAAGVTSELFEKSRGFRDLLEAARRRGTELDSREQAVTAREAALKSLEATVTAEVARLEKIGPTRGATPAPTAAAGAAAGAAPAPTATATGGAEPTTRPCDVAITKIYASMKPEEAAAIIDRLDDATAANVFVCMKEKQIGAIMAAMKPDRAVALTHALGGGAAEKTTQQ
jgi:flagellar motility protein MotE (MotC chaperone)